MTLAEMPPGPDANTDLRRLIDAGYSITFSAPPAGYDAPAYMVTLTTPGGSMWRAVGWEPVGALRMAWPLGYGPGQGGCGHCDGMGCTRPDCAICAAWLDGEHVSGDCGVCGVGDPYTFEDDGQGDDATADEDDECDEDTAPEAYCTVCGASVGIFLGHGDGWQHYRGEGTAAKPNELFDAGHAPVIGWREVKTL